MQHENFKLQLQKLFGYVFKVDPSTITDDFSPDNVENWDSLSHIQLTMEIEEVFRINLTTEEIIRLDSFAKAYKIITEKKNLVKEQ